MAFPGRRNPKQVISSQRGAHDLEILERLARWRLTQYLDVADYLLIAEAVLGMPAEEIAGWPGIGLADSARSAQDLGWSCD